MELEFETLDGTPVGRIRGDIDVTNIHAVEHAVIDNVSNRAFGLVLDLTGVTYLDSAGIRLLFQLASRLQSRQLIFVLAVPEEALVNRTLDAAGAHASFHIRRSVSGAIAAIEESKLPPKG